MHRVAPFPFEHRRIGVGVVDAELELGRPTFAFAFG